MFTAFTPAISPEALKDKISREVAAGGSTPEPPRDLPDLADWSTRSSGAG